MPVIKALSEGVAPATCVTVLLEKFRHASGISYFLELHGVTDAIERDVLDITRNPDLITSHEFGCQQIGDIFMIEGTKAEMFLILTDVITYFHEHAVEYTYDYQNKETA